MATNPGIFVDARQQTLANPKANSIIDVVSIIEPESDKDLESKLRRQSDVLSGLMNDDDKFFPSSNWGRPAVNIIATDPDLLNDFSSIDSFALTDSPDGTISSQGASSRSSQSSLSGLAFQTTSNGGSSSTRSLRRSQGSHSRTGSSSLSFISGSSNNASKSDLNRLKSQCSKFGSRHNAGKANYLRLTLLPFLRKHHMGPIAVTASEALYAQKIFGLWWSSLLDVLKSNFKHINGVDRDAFCEAISSIISRPEWDDHQMQQLYQNLLAQTTNYVISKCSTTLSLPTSQSAFTGKVLAYAFFYLPGMSRYLLRLMNVQPRTIEHILNGGAAKKYSPKTALLNSESACFDALPAHLRPLVGALETPDIPLATRADLSKLVNKTTQSWERHFTMDSAIFASFFKHYCTLQCKTLLSLDNQIGIEFVIDQGGAQTVIYGEDIILSSPGMVLVLAAIVDSLDKVSNDTGRSLGPRNANPYSLRQQTGNSGNNKQAAQGSAERIRIDQLKILSSLREILHSDDNTSPFFLAFSRTFDRVFKAIALETHVHDMSGCVTVCDLAEEWISSVFAVSTTKASGILSPYKHLVLDWRFWLDVADRMLKSDNCHTEIRAISFLFNTWPHIPTQDVTNPEVTNASLGEERSIIKDATEWIMSPDVWNRMFCHWSPLVRSYYQRFLCYRISSVGADSVSWYLDVETSQYLSESRELLKRRLAESFLWCESLSQKAGMKPELCPSLPMPRLRVGIRQFGPAPSQASKVETNLTRVYPFDVYDSVAYLQPESVHEEPVSLSPVIERRNSTESTSSFRSITVAAHNESYQRSENVSVLDSESDGAHQTSNSSPSMTSPLGISSKTVSPKSELTRDDASDSSGITLKGKGMLPRRLSFVGSLKQRTTETESKEEPLPGPENSSPENNKVKIVVNEQTINKVQRPFLQKRFSLLRKLLPNRKSAPAVLENPNSKDQNILEYPFVTKSSESNSKSKSILLHPPQLTQARAEINRSPFRFVMIPTSIRPLVRADLAAPRLPFSNELCFRNYSLDIEKRDTQKDLAMWNYGGRALAEWNIEVICFERFALQQRQTVNDTLEMFPMPFMVTEIPWRTLG